MAVANYMENNTVSWQLLGIKSISKSHKHFRATPKVCIEAMSTVYWNGWIYHSNWHIGYGEQW